MANADTAKLVAELSLKDKLSAGVNSALKSVGRLDKGLGRSAKGVGQLGLGMGRVLALGAGAAAVALGAAGKAAIDFEDAFAGVKKTVDATDLAVVGSSFEKLKGEFLGLSTTIPITASELARLGESAGALGVKAQDITAFAEVTAKLGVTTNLTADEAADALGRIGTILGLTGKQYEDLADVIVNLGNKGATTEVEIVEITKRFAAAGKAAGLTTQQIVAFSAAISSAGVEPEAAGGALSRLFGKVVQETALATAKAKAFAKVSGKSFKDFAKLVKTDTNAAMLLFIKSLSKLDKFEQARALKDVGITNTRDINAIRLLAQTYEQNLIPAMENAADSAGALDKESAVRFDTIKSKWQMLKNAFIKGGIEMGDGFLPALGRLTTKVTTWVNANSSKLQSVGRDIGKALDGIDWKEVERGAMRVGDAAKVILDVVKQIPTEVKLGGAAFLGLDKASGGLLSSGLGNVGGGAVNIVMDRFLARGSSAANPVWVAGTGIGDGPGGGGSKSDWLRNLANATIAIGIALGVKEGIDEANKSTGASFKLGFSGPDLAQNIVSGFALVMRDLFPPTPKPVVPRALPSDRNLDGSALRPKPAGPTAFFRPDKVDAIKAAQDKTTTAVETMRGNLRNDLLGFKSQSATDARIIAANVARSGLEIKSQTRVAGITAALASTRAGDRATAAAHGTTRAIDRKRSTVVITVRNSIREQANAVTSRSTHKIL